MKEMLKVGVDGLVPAIAQHHETGQILMLGYVSRESLRRTLETGDVWFYSRARKELWEKGRTSGNYLKVKSVALDCDGDALLLKVDPQGPTCHTGEPTCFFVALNELPEMVLPEAGSVILDEVYQVIKDRIGNPTSDSYTAQLVSSGVGRIAQKVVEEAGETAISAVERDKKGMTSEVADLFYHALVLLASMNVSPQDVWAELQSRRTETK